jgi:hypothetical protein
LYIVDNIVLYRLGEREASLGSLEVVVKEALNNQARQGIVRAFK